MLKLCLLFFHLCKTLATINRTIIFGLERNLCLAATACTSCCVHLSIAFSSVLSCIAASLASLGLVYKAFFSVELLLTCCKTNSLPHSLQIRVLSSYILLPRLKNYFTLSGIAPPQKCSPNEKRAFDEVLITALVILLQLSPNPLKRIVNGFG